MFQEIARSLVGSNGTGHLGQELRELKHLGENDLDHHWRDRDRFLLLVNSQYSVNKVLTNQHFELSFNNFRVNLADILSILSIKIVFKYIYFYKLVMIISWMLPSTR
ncbi:hypothetical protein [Nostoc sp.]|uniref:hypothetical protein n=1 Tax=Nostoc sp. TaxID=1180 RepID=UPI002FF50C3E